MLTGFRLRRIVHLPTLFCRNPKCGDQLPDQQRLWRWELCPSCRLAYGRGALLAGLVGFIATIAAKLLG